jgi:hypothetical protein
MVVGRAAAQATLALTGGSGAPGASVTVGVSLSTNGTQPAAVQFDLGVSTLERRSTDRVDGSVAGLFRCGRTSSD